MRWLRVIGVGLLLTTLAGYTLYAALLYGFQDTLLYPVPQRDRAFYDQQAAQAGVEPFMLDASDGTQLYGWHGKGAGKRAVLFFHGNGGGLSVVGWIKQQLPADVDVFCVHYRGYPGSEGSPSEAGMALDAQAIWLHLLDQGFAPENIVVHAQSLGGGVAVRLVEGVRPAALVLDSTFLGVDVLAAEKFPLVPTFLLKNPYRSVDRAPNLRLPTLVIHGDHDTLIPVSHGRRLAELIPGARYIEVPGGGHDQFLPDREDVRPTWRAFVVEALGGETPER